MASPPPSFIQIMDPVAGYHYTLDSRNQTARRMAIPSAAHWFNTAATLANPPRPSVLPATTAAFKADSTRLHPEVSRESLGTQAIAGVLAEGTRTTTTFPVDFVRNDRPITRVSETWISPDLKMAVLSKTSDPRSGEGITKLINIVLGRARPIALSGAGRVFDRRRVRTRNPVALPACSSATQYAVTQSHRYPVRR